MPPLWRFRRRCFCSSWRRACKHRAMKACVCCRFQRRRICPGGGCWRTSSHETRAAQCNGARHCRVWIGCNPRAGRLGVVRHHLRGLGRDHGGGPGTPLPAVFARRMAVISPSAAEGFGLWAFVSKFTLAFAAVFYCPPSNGGRLRSGAARQPRGSFGAAQSALRRRALCAEMCRDRPVATTDLREE